MKLHKSILLAISLAFVMALGIPVVQAAVPFMPEAAVAAASDTATEIEETVVNLDEAAADYAGHDPADIYHGEDPEELERENEPLWFNGGMTIVAAIFIGGAIYFFFIKPSKRA
ncbi:MAG: hypothetical protein FWE46_03610 [Coriobacteriia bacterium]|nr:hypothetical protein [Coriobacteriia bacterium]MCL2537389.1 hypothetical protein [Coriobacteriia bacterium]